MTLSEAEGRRLLRPREVEHRTDHSTTGEIALNPLGILHREPETSLSTLVHAMGHLEQHHFGKPGRGRDHNKERAEMMAALGPEPTSTAAEPGGKRGTGDRVWHMIVGGGPFDVAGRGSWPSTRAGTGETAAREEGATPPSAGAAAASGARRLPGRGLRLAAWARPASGSIVRSANPRSRWPGKARAGVTHTTRRIGSPGARAGLAGGDGPALAEGLVAPHGLPETSRAKRSPEQSKGGGSTWLWIAKSTCFILSEVTCALAPAWRNGEKANGERRNGVEASAGGAPAKTISHRTSPPDGRAASADSRFTWDGRS